MVNQMIKGNEIYNFDINKYDINDEQEKQKYYEDIQKMYKKLKKSFDIAIYSMTENEKKEYKDIFINAYMQAYRDELYKNAE